MSRNESRTGLENTHVPQDTDITAPVAASVPTEEPRLNWAMPTEIVELPSRGRFYGPDHPLHGKTSLEIRYMTAKEEDIITSQALIREGVAVDRMIQSLLVDRTVDVNTLLLGDKNALIVASRITGYGPEYNTTVSCPACTQTTRHTFDLTEQSHIEFEEAIASGDCFLDENNHLVVALPFSQVEVRCRFMTGKDELEQFKRAKRKSKTKRDQNNLTDAFKNYIVSVNGSSDGLDIRTFVEAMPARDSFYLRSLYGAATPNVNMTQNFECENCGHEADMEVPLTVDFLWPRRQV